MTNKVAKLLVSVVKGDSKELLNYSHEDKMEVARKELIEANGGSDKLTPKSFRNNPELFSIIEETLDILISEGIKEQFDMFVETVELEHGDTKVFTVEENRLFNVANISDGIGASIRRDRLDSGELTVRTSTYAVSIYEELSRVLAGRTDFVKMIENVDKSYQNKIKEEIYRTIYESFDTLGATYGRSGTFKESELDELIGHVESATDMDVMILGTKSALSKIKYDRESTDAVNNHNQFGFYGTFHGTPMMAIKQAHKNGSDKFAIDNNFIMVVPRLPDKFVKLVLEGDSLIIEGNPEGRRNLQYEYTFIKKAGIAVIHTSQYGIYRISK